MNRKPRLFASTLIGTVLAASSAAAEEFTCNGTVGAVTLDNVVVPPDGMCVLEGTVVEGTIKVERGAVLAARGVNVIGNVQGENAAAVDVLDGSRVGGSIQVVQGRSARVVDTDVTGDVLYDDNTGELEARRNVIGGSLQVFQNTGGAEIYRNRIDGNLQCKENGPPPQGAGNVVQGNIEDQCAGFDALAGSTTTSTVPAGSSTTTTLATSTTLPGGPRCGQPLSAGERPIASDCLHIVRAAVGSEQCSPQCICDTDGSSDITASDGLTCLKVAIGQPVDLQCPC